MKKILAVFLASCMCLAFVACGKTEEKKPTASNQIIVGSTTDVEANMMAGWTNGAQNNSIRTLIFGYSPIAYTKDGQFIFDPQVVKEHSDKTNEDGSKTYTIKICDDLTWNNGEKITAKDYVFSMLLSSTTQLKSCDADDLTYNSDLVGYDDFSKNGGVFSGIRYIDDSTYSVTISKEALPFYFELATLDLTLYPLSVVAPGCDIKDEGKGAFIDGPFTDELLAKSINTAETGYRYAPKVSAGAYQFDSFDTTTKQAILTINPKFKGTYDNVKPTIEKIILKKVTDETQMDELRAGSVDLIGGVSGGNAINGGLKVVEDGLADKATYLRAGYGKITFSCDFGPTQFQAVRQAIAYCLDRTEFAKTYSGGYAKVVNGFYGLSMWEYKENKDTIENDLNKYTKNLDQAKKLLVEDGWTLNKDGKDFVEGTDDVRYKKVDGKLMACEINWANTPNNPVSDLLNTMLPGEMAKVGMKLNPTTIEFGVLLENLYRKGDIQNNPTYNMFNLATGFVPVAEMWYDYSTDKKYDGSYNTNFIHDEKLAEKANALKSVAPGDKETWSTKWVEFEKEWNRALPDIPLYSDQYHDFYNKKLTNYEPDALWQWERAIVYASVK